MPRRERSADMNGNLAYDASCGPEPMEREPWREELIGGKWVAMSPARTNHNRIKSNINSLFWNFLKDRTCEVLPDGEAVYLTETDYYYPDVMVVCDPDKIQEDGVYGAPDLVVEVLSPGTVRYDRGRKMKLYAQCGVREYWLVTPSEKVVEQYLPENGVFVLHDSFALHPDWELKRMKPEELAEVRAEFRCSLYDDLTIRLEDIFLNVT